MPMREKFTPSSVKISCAILLCVPFELWIFLLSSQGIFMMCSSRNLGPYNMQLIK